MQELTIDPAMKAKVVVEDKKKAAPGTKAPIPIADQGPPLRHLPKLEKAKIAFFLDGECQGVAFENLYDFLPLRQHQGDQARSERKKADPRTNWHDDGTCAYYPHVSVFGGGIASINPGPEFAFPPPPDIEAALRESPHPPLSAPLLDPKRKRRQGPSGEDVNWRPLSERYPEFLAEQHHLDDLDEQEAVRVFAEQAQKDALQTGGGGYGAQGGGGGGGGDGHPLKKGRMAAGPSSSRLEELGVVKKEDVASVNGSPAPPASFSPRSGLRRGSAAPSVGLGEGALQEEGKDDGA